MKLPIFSPVIAFASLIQLPAQLVGDSHWDYDNPQMRVEPFAFANADGYLYAGGLFLGTDGVSDGKNFVRFDYATETWEQAPGLTDGLDGRVDVIYPADDGMIYVGGNFGQPAGTSAKRIARLNPATGVWTSLFDPNSNLTLGSWDNGPVDGRVLAIAKVGNEIFVGGNFTNGAAPENERYILRYNLTTKAWGPVGAGTGGHVDDLEVLPNGDVLAATRNDDGLMLWNGTSWSAFAGGIGGTGIARRISRTPDGRIFIAGSFDLVGSTNLACSDVAAYNPATGAWDNLDGGFDDQYIQSNGTTFTADGVYDMVVDDNGRVIVGGDFQANPDRSNLGLNHIAMWDDSGEWKALGSGLGSTGSQNVNCLAIAPGGDLYAGGTFSRGWLASKSATTQFARWNPDLTLTPIPDSFGNPIVTIEDGTMFLSVRTVAGEQYQIRRSSSPEFIGASDVGGRRGGSNFGLSKWELGAAPVSGAQFYRVEER